MKHSHVVTVTSGFGLRVIPRMAPYRFALGPGPDQLDVECFDGQRWAFARLTPDAGGYGSQLDDGTESLGDVADVVKGPESKRWWAETSAFRFELPRDWVLWASPEQSAAPFDLLGPGDGAIYIQTPSRRPELHELAAPGQRVTGSATGDLGAWIDLAYEHEGVEWSQRHVVRVVGTVPMVVSAQAPRASDAAALETLARILATLAPMGRETAR